VEYFSPREEITEAEMDALNIPKGKEEGEKKETPKDQRVLHRRRAVLLTKDTHVERRNKQREEKQMAEVQKELATQEKVTRKRKRKQEEEEKQEMRKKVKLEKQAAMEAKRAAAAQKTKLR